MMKLLRKNKGSISVLGAVSLPVIIGLAAFAVDLGYCYLKHSELQNAADAGAMAGAAGIVSFGDDLERARSTAVEFARKNLSDEDSPELAVTSNDVTFYKDGVAGAADPDEVEVLVKRTGASGNAVSLFFARMFGVDLTDVAARARAKVIRTNGSRCLKPFTLPQKFTWNDKCDSDKKYKNNGELDVNSACEVASVVIEEWSDNDIGAEFTLKIGDPSSTIVSGFYNPVDYPPVNKGTPTTGASAYSVNIAGCSGSNNVEVEAGDEIQMEPGNMVGPTNHGLDDLIASDPGAYWDSATNSIKGSSYDDPMASPRVVLVPFYDPRQPPVSGRNSLYVYSFGAFFIEDTRGSGSIVGHMIEAFAFNPVGPMDQSLLYTVLLTRDSSR